MSRDTIFAPATAPGKSGVAIVRLSGPQAAAALHALTGLSTIEPGLARYMGLRVPKTHALIDHGLALYFKAPGSFTGEDVAELQVHGSPAVLRELLEVLSSLPGLRPAEPGEFSRRAFLNGKMDLVEAEGLADLIAAETSQQKTQAQRQMQGELSDYYSKLREHIVQSLAHLEAYIDFPEEEIPESVREGLAGSVEVIKTTINNALKDENRGQALREGMHVVILGAPNAGKSSLLNAIAKKDAAIVSHKAGTTRDVIEVHLDVAGYPVVLTDTAGVRESTDDIEEEGIRRALARAGGADLKLVLFSVDRAPEPKILELVDAKTIVLATKADIPGGDPLKISPTALAVSAKTGEGMDALLSLLETRIISYFTAHAAPVITRNRHRALLQEALAQLQQFSPEAPLELACENLRLAAGAVGKITGKIQVDELLDVIFRQFCIGK